MTPGDTDNELTPEVLAMLKEEFSKLWYDASMAITKRTDKHWLVSASLWNGFKAGYVLGRDEQPGGS